MWIHDAYGNLINLANATCIFSRFEPMVNPDSNFVPGYYLFVATNNGNIVISRALDEKGAESALAAITALIDKHQYSYQPVGKIFD